MQSKQLLLAGLFYLSFLTAAQAQTSLQDSSKSKMIRDIVKINVSALTVKNVSVQYEHILSKKFSVALGGRMMPSTAIPYDDMVNDILGYDGQDTRNIVNISRLSNIAITPEARYYLGKGYGQGFYVAPYYRFMLFSSNTIIVNYTNKSVTMNGDLTAHTGGVMVGAQWFLNKNISFDWWIAGAHFGFSKGKFTGVPTNPLNPEEQADLKSRLSGISIPLVHKEVTVTSNDILATFNGGFGGARAGVSLGIRW